MATRLGVPPNHEFTSALEQLRRGLGKLATEAARRLYPSHFATPERDIARVCKRLERVGQALRLLR